MMVFSGKQGLSLSLCIAILGNWLHRRYATRGLLSIKTLSGIFVPLVVGFLPFSKLRDDHVDFIAFVGYTLGNIIHNPTVAGAINDASTGGRCLISLCYILFPVLLSAVYRRGGALLVAINSAVLFFDFPLCFFRLGHGSTVTVNEAVILGRGPRDATDLSNAALLSVLPLYVMLCVAASSVVKAAGAGTLFRPKKLAYSPRIRSVGGFIKAKGIRTSDITASHRDAMRSALSDSLSAAGVDPVSVSLGFVEGCVLFLPSVSLPPGTDPALIKRVEQVLEGLTLRSLLPGDLALEAQREDRECLDRKLTFGNGGGRPEALGSSSGASDAAASEDPALECRPPALVPFVAQTVTLTLWTDRLPAALRRQGPAAAGLGLDPARLKAAAHYTPCDAPAAQAAQADVSGSGSPSLALGASCAAPLPLEVVSPWRSAQGGRGLTCRVRVPALRCGAVSVIVGLTGPDGHLISVLPGCEAAAPVLDSRRGAREACTFSAAVASDFGPALSAVLLAATHAAAAAGHQQHPTTHPSYGPYGSGAVVEDLNEVMPRMSSTFSSSPFTSDAAAGAAGWASLAEEMVSDARASRLPHLASFLERRVAGPLRGEGPGVGPEPRLSPWTLTYEDPEIESVAASASRPRLRSLAIWANSLSLLQLSVALSWVPAAHQQVAMYWSLPVMAVFAVGQVAAIFPGIPLLDKHYLPEDGQMFKVMNALSGLASLFPYTAVNAMGVAERLLRDANEPPYGMPYFVSLCMYCFMVRYLRAAAPLRESLPIFTAYLSLQFIIELHGNFFQGPLSRLYYEMHVVAYLLSVGVCYLVQRAAAREAVERWRRRGGAREVEGKVEEEDGY